jgi:hypothetical protein
MTSTNNLIFLEIYHPAVSQRTTWGSVTSANSAANNETDVDSEKDNPFVTKESRTARKRRKQASPITNESDLPSQAKRPNTNAMSYVAAVTKNISPRGANVPATTTNQQQRPIRSATQKYRVVGRADFPELKAAPRKFTEKVVFSITNVASDYTVDDIKQHRRRLDIRVLFCFDVTQGNRDARSFKLAVIAPHADKITDNSS